MAISDPDINEFKRLIQERIPEAWCMLASNDDENESILEIEYDGTIVTVSHVLGSDPAAWSILQVSEEPGTVSMVKNAYNRADARDRIMEDVLDWLGIPQ